MRSRSRDIAVGIVGLAVVGIVFVIPFLFMLVIAAKDRAEASRFEFSLPSEWLLWENIQAVLDTRDGLILTAFRNSIAAHGRLGRADRARRDDGRLRAPAAPRPRRIARRRDAAPRA